ncbi:MAG: fibro-slime domain-containing protein [Fibrobacterales bacterium]
MRHLPLLIAFFVVTSCFLESTPNEQAHENTAQLCNDTQDNDADGYVDCLDQDCLGFYICAGDSTNGSSAQEAESDNDGQLPDGTVRVSSSALQDSSDTRYEVREDSYYTCQDSLDNDSNGLVDCYDPGCGAFIFCHIPSENTALLCNDSVDNDGDGKIDCLDESCKIFQFCDDPAENSLRECTDLLDNDGDDLIDCDDLPCKAYAVCQEALENTTLQCADGIDNDEDGLVDCDDNEYCKNFSWCQEPLENTAQQCFDGIDNDEDGLVDCDDNEYCKNFSWCQEPLENTAQQCADGIDNDGDGLFDCEDITVNCTDALNCDTLQTCATFAVCQRYENTEALCSDGEDNDNNGYIDCGDEGCADLILCDSREVTAAQCQDGIDNDDNGDTDCDDRQCQQYSFCAENNSQSCSDGIDNDGDTLVDCDDDECLVFPVCGIQPFTCLSQGYELPETIVFDIVVYDKPEAGDFSLTNTQSAQCPGIVDEDGIERPVHEASTGMVKGTLSSDGLPVLATNVCTNSTIGTWWSKTGAAKNVELAFTHTGDNVYSFRTAGEGFFPLDGCIDGGSEMDIIADTLIIGKTCAVSGASRNYGFSAHLTREFYYVENGAEDQNFSFSGDDDVFVFINDQLILDIGGVHKPVTGQFNLKGAVAYINNLSVNRNDSIKTGDIVKFDLFIAERRKTGSQVDIMINIPCLTVGLGALDTITVD